MITIFELAYFSFTSVLAASFLAAGVAKIHDRPSFQTSLDQFGFPKNISKYVVYVVPIWEMLLAALIMVQKTSHIGAIASVITLSTFAIFQSYHLIKKNKVVCNCFGNFSQTPTTWITIFRNLALVVGGAIILVYIPEAPKQWFQIATIATSLALAEGWMLWIANAKLKEKEKEIWKALPKERKIAPTFMLPATDGEQVSLKKLIDLGHPILLVFIDPVCGPCDILMPYLAIWQKQFASSLAVQIISRRSLNENRKKAEKYGVNNIAVQNDFEVANAYNIKATPSALLITSDGIITTEVIIGPGEIIKLVTGSDDAQFETVILAEKAGKDTSEKIQLDVGQLIPKIWLRDVEGYSINLLDIEKKSSLLLFWEPKCANCDSFWAAFDSAIAELVNKPKTILVLKEQEEIVKQNFDVVAFDVDFTAGRMLGLESSPAAILIDCKGKLKLPIAQTANDILRLLQMIQFMEKEFFVSDQHKN